MMITNGDLYPTELDSMPAVDWPPIHNPVLFWLYVAIAVLSGIIGFVCLILTTKENLKDFTILRIILYVCSLLIILCLLPILPITYILIALIGTPFLLMIKYGWKNTKP